MIQQELDKRIKNDLESNINYEIILIIIKYILFIAFLEFVIYKILDLSSYMTGIH